MVKGFVIKYLNHRNFGFIERSDVVAKQIFFHKSDVEQGYGPCIGDNVEFEMSEFNGKPVAIKVKRLEDEEKEDRGRVKLYKSLIILMNFF